MEKKEPITDTKLLGELADLIRDARDLSKKVSAREASEIGKILEQAHGMLNDLLQRHGAVTKKLDD
jgi:hypothetical protein